MTYRTKEGASAHGFRLHVAAAADGWALLYQSTDLMLVGHVCLAECSTDSGTLATAVNHPLRHRRLDRPI
jgi:hypothetical protein